MERMSLIERIDFIRANSVTDEEFKSFWGYSLDDCVKRVMSRVRKMERSADSSKP